MSAGEARDAVKRAPRTPNAVLRGIREERGQTRAEFAEAMARIARETGEEVYPDWKYVERLESGEIAWPRPVYRNILEKLCGRPIWQLGFIPRAYSAARSPRTSVEPHDSVNVALRDAIWASGMEATEFARRVEVSPKTVERWITRGRIPHPLHRWKACQILGHAESELWSGAIPAQEFAQGESTAMRSASVPTFDPAGIADQISELANWAEATNVGDGALSYLDSSVFELAHDCLTVPPLQTSLRADMLVKRIYGILRSGHQRLGQTRDLYVIAGKLCAILSWIASDLGQLAIADAHARNGWTLADQADHDGLRALLLSAQSKNDFWRRRYGDAAMRARRGYEFNPRGTLRVLLACQEADAQQAMGRLEDAIGALARAELAKETLSGTDELGGIFGCGVARQSNYSISTYLRSGSVEQALLHVERAERAWLHGEEWAYGTWAQVQIGAAIANLMSGEIEAAATILRKVLDQPIESRLATLTTRLRNEVSPLLTGSAVEHNKFAIMLRENITDYGQSPIRQLSAGGDL